MKIKKFNKVLNLNKSTISNLNSNQMNAAKGGYFETDFQYTCHTYCGCETNYWLCQPTRYADTDCLCTLYESCASPCDITINFPCQ